MKYQPKKKNYRITPESTKGIKVYFDKIHTSSLDNRFPGTRSSIPEKRRAQQRGPETRCLQISYFSKKETKVTELRLMYAISEQWWKPTRQLRDLIPIHRNRSEKVQTIVIQRMITKIGIPNIKIHEIRDPNVLLLTTLPKFMGIVGFLSRTFSVYDAKF